MSLQATMMHVLYDFEPEEPGSVAVRKGDVVPLYGEDEVGWGFIRNLSNKCGKVPISYLTSEALRDGQFCKGYMEEDSVTIKSTLVYLSKAKKTRAYVVRPHPIQKRALAMTFMCKDKNIRTLTIRLKTNMKYVLWGDNIERDSVQELINYYNATEPRRDWGKLKYPCTLKDVQDMKEFEAKQVKKKLPAPPPADQADTVNDDGGLAPSALAEDEQEEAQFTVRHIDHLLTMLQELPQLTTHHVAAMDRLSVARFALLENRRLDPELQTFVTNFDVKAPARSVAAPASALVRTPVKAAATLAPAAPVPQAVAAAATEAAADPQPRRIAPPSPPRSRSQLGTQRKAAGTTLRKNKRTAPKPYHSDKRMSQLPDMTRPIRAAPAPPPGGASRPQPQPVDSSKSQVAKSLPPSPGQPLPPPPAAASQLATASQSSPSRKLPTPNVQIKTVAQDSQPEMALAEHNPVQASAIAPQAFAQPAPSEREVEVPSIEEILASLKTSVVQQVRDNNDITYLKSKGAVLSVLDAIWASVDDPRVLAAVAAVVSGPEEVIEGGFDVPRLHHVLENITTMQRDRQQREWSAHDDTSAISDMLTTLKNLAREGNPDLMQSIVRTWNSPGQVCEYEIIETLTSYYQMETRVALKVLLLEVFDTLSAADASILSVLKVSAVPVELARELTDGKVPLPASNPEELQRQLMTLKLVTKIFSLGDGIMPSHEEYLAYDFTSALFNAATADPADPMAEQVCNQALVALLSFNKNFPSFQRNPLFAVVVENGAERSPQLGMAVLPFLNRGTDPVADCLQELADPTLNPQLHSVMKLLQDVFGAEPCAKVIVYDADLQVLFDVMLRELTDREPSDPATMAYLQLLELVLSNSKYSESVNIQAETADRIEHVLSGIKINEDPQAMAAQAMAARILAAQTLSVV
eukprot:m.28788 g.28788  ORF g.28788 m.28788 type:complete len:921 (+) comp9078_c0_seq2:126-2888(+)